MPDHFATLDQSRRPWLDADTLKDAFHRASATCHPDVAGSGDASRFAEVNAAYSALRDPVGRLRHLLDIEAPEQLGKTQVIPPELSDLFMQLAALHQALQAFLKKEDAAAPGLARALLAGERMALSERLTQLKEGLQEAHDTSLLLLRDLDAEWSSRPPDAGERLATLHQRFAFLSKWRAQLSESMFQFQLNS